MKFENIYSLENISSYIRLFTAGIRFLFLLILSYFEKIDLIAFLALVYAIHGFFVFLIPFDFYVNTISSYKNITKNGISKIASHWIFIFISCCLFVLLSFTTTKILDIPHKSSQLYVIFLIVTEVINSELNRILLVRARVFISALMLFLRWSLLPVIISICLTMNIEVNEIIITKIWLTSSILSIFLFLLFNIKATSRIFSMSKLRKLVLIFHLNLKPQQHPQKRP